MKFEGSAIRNNKLSVVKLLRQLPLVYALRLKIVIASATSNGILRIWNDETIKLGRKM